MYIAFLEFASNENSLNLCYMHSRKGFGVMCIALYMQEITTLKRGILCYH